MKNVYIHETATVDIGASIGEGTKVWHYSHLMPKAIIGRECIIGQNVFIDNNVVIGNKVKIQNNVSIYTGVIIEDSAFLGPSVVFTNVINPRSFIERKSEFKQTIIKTGATLGANCTIICGVQIGSYSLIGAGSVVTKKVKEFALYYGNPGIQKGWISKWGHKLEFNAAGQAICPQSGDIYYLEKGCVRSEREDLFPEFSFIDI